MAGQEVWRTSLKGGDFVNVVVQDGDLCAATKGEVFCLDASTGRVRWHNQLRGMGTGLVTIAGAGDQQSVVMHAKKQRDEAAAAAAGAAIV